MSPMSTSELEADVQDPDRICHREEPALAVQTSGQSAFEECHGSPLMHRPTFRLELAPFGLESLAEYQEGGLHPVHLGDGLGHNARYRVVSKLGHGGFATVWLCRDTFEETSTKDVAVKVLMADASTKDYRELNTLTIEARLDKGPGDSDDKASISLPLDHFTIEGPNGRHYCFVYKVNGPKFNYETLPDPEDHAKLLRNSCHGLIRAISMLHEKGICHGDITPSNILHRMRGFDGMSEEDVIHRLGQPRHNPVVSLSSENVHDKPGIPRYLVYPVHWTGVSTDLWEPRPTLIDFGEWYEATAPPEDLGIPGAYRAPELILDNEMGIGADLWALGCTLFTVRTGRKLFGSFDDHDDDYLEGMMRILGKLPEPWWSTWEFRLDHYKDEVDDDGKVIELNPEDEADTSNCHPSLAPGARSIKEKLEPGLWHMPERPPWTHRVITQEEIVVFADLLGKLLKFNPNDRISAAEAAEHEWFKLP